MAGNARDSSSDGSESEPEPELEEEAPEFLYDAKTQDIIIDFRAASSLPFDPDSDAVKSLRAMMFGRGKGMHAPNEAGKVFVFGEWKLLTSLMKVHFVGYIPIDSLSFCWRSSTTDSPTQQ